MNPTEFFEMGGYGAYVWPCYLLTIGVLIWNAFAARRQHRLAREQALRRLDDGRLRT